MAICAGVGGLELGIKLAIPDYRCVCYIEREAYASAVLITRMGEGYLDIAPIWDDVETFDGKPWSGIVDIISSGFPCQPVSCAGKRKGIKDERWIWPQISRIIGEVGPRYLFLENVPEIINNGASEILGSLAKMGYNAIWGRFSAAGIGASHIRWRWFLLAYPSGQRGPEITRSSYGYEIENARGTEKKTDVANGNDKGNRKWDVADPISIRWHEGERYLHGGKSNIEGCNWWESEPPMGRMANGIPNWVDRLRACGNGVVPIVAGFAFIKLGEIALNIQDGESQKR